MREIPAAAGMSESDLAAVISVSKVVDIGDSSGRGIRRQEQQRRRFYVRGWRRVVGGS